MMRTVLRRIAIAFVAYAACTASGSASAQTLPAFEVTAPDGQPVASTALPSGSHWVIAYVVPGSAPSDRLVQALGEAWAADLLSRIVIIVGADVDAARKYLEDKGQGVQGKVAWYVDADASAWKALQFDGTLGVAGMDGQQVDWKIDGVINDPSVVEPATRAWLERSIRPSGE
jgi:hypothetical protein